MASYVPFDLIVVPNFRLLPEVLHRPLPCLSVARGPVSMTNDRQKVGVFVNKGVDDRLLIFQDSSRQSDDPCSVVGESGRDSIASPDDLWDVT